MFYLIIGVLFAAVIFTSLYNASRQSAVMEQALLDATRELETAKAGEEFYRNCLPGIMQRTVIEWRQGWAFCKKYEWRGKRIIEVERHKVATVEGMLGYPLPKGNED